MWRTECSPPDPWWTVHKPTGRLPDSRGGGDTPCDGTTGGVARFASGGCHRRAVWALWTHGRRRRPLLRWLRRRAGRRLPALPAPARLGRHVLHLVRVAPAGRGPAGRGHPAGGPPPGQRALRRPHRLHPVRRAGRPGAGPRHADRFLRRRPTGGRPVRRGGGEVHRRRGDGALRRAGRHRDRRAALRTGRAGAATGAHPVRADRAAPSCGSGSAWPPARRSSTWPPPATAARRSWPATW